MRFVVGLVGPKCVQDTPTIQSDRSADSQMFLPGIEENEEGCPDLKPCLEPTIGNRGGVIDRGFMAWLVDGFWLNLRRGFLVHL